MFALAGRAGVITVSPIQRGFTLLEIMVVVVLIAITATYAVINLQRDYDRLAELELRRLNGMMEQLRDEAVLTGRSYAIEFLIGERRWRFLQAGPEGWEPLEGDDLFADGAIPEPLLAEFSGAPAAGDQAVRDLVVFQPDGSITPFELKLTGRQRIYRLHVDPAQNLLTDDREIEKS